MTPLKTFIVAVTMFTFISCGPEFLDIRRDANQVVPTHLNDYEAIINNNNVMNETSLGLGMIGAGEFYVSEEVLNALSPANAWQLNAYLWTDDTFEGGEARDWNNPYQRILYANLALDVARVDPVEANPQALNTVKGQALFHRAWNYFQLAQTFCDYFQQGSEQVGLPIRTDYDVSQPSKRYSLRETFERILEDVESAIGLLPDTTEHQFQPSKSAAYALLARILLYLADYERAAEAADQALKSRSELLDFHQLDQSLRYSFSELAYGNNNPEVIFHCHNTAFSIMANSRMNVDSNLYRSYDTNDLRKILYFETERDGRITFKGSYRGNAAFFTGLATDELYLIQAECAVRRGDLTLAQSYLNTLLESRYVTGTFGGVVLTGMSLEGALGIILEEREKELYMRGSRWGDIKRLNAEGHAISLERTFMGRHYMLTPNASNWSYPIPDNERTHVAWQH